MHDALVTETWPPEVNGVALTVRSLQRGLLRRGRRVSVVRPAQHPGQVAAVRGERGGIARRTRPALPQRRACGHADRERPGRDFHRACPGVALPVMG